MSEPEKIKVTTEQGKDIRAIGSDTTEEQRRAALDKVADALRRKNEGGK